MLRKSITYTNPFTDQEVTETHYFHISKADLVEMEMEENKATYTNEDGETVTGMQAKLQQIVDSKDGRAIMTEFKDIIRRSYGRKEGERFVKSTQIWEEFASTEAYSQLLWELCTDAAASSAFINGIIPKNLEQVAAEVKPQQTPNPLGKAPEDPTGLTKNDTPRVLSQKEMREMDSTELQSGLASGKYKL